MFGKVLGLGLEQQAARRQKIEGAERSATAFAFEYTPSTDPIKFDHGIQLYSLAAEVKPCKVTSAKPKILIIELFDFFYNVIFESRQQGD
jgi:hypothetical protein